MNKKQVAVIWIGITILITVGLYLRMVWQETPGARTDIVNCFFIVSIPIISLSGLLIYLFKDKKK